MFKEKTIIQICVVLSILLLPIAHLKVHIFGMPLYSVEMPTAVALLVYVYGWWHGIFSPSENINFRNPLVVGGLLFFFGAVLSFVLNPFSLTGLGMLKTWFIVPLILVWLWVESKPEQRAIEKMLLVWLGVVASVSFLSLEYLFQGVLTFDGRLSSWYASPNYLAFFLAPGILLASYFYSHPLFEKKKWSKRMIGCIFLSLLVSLFFTHSYAVWVSLFITTLFFLFCGATGKLFWQKKRILAVFLVIVFVSFLFFESGSGKWQALVSLQERSSLSSRMMIWQVATKAIVDAPFFGIGLGRFQEVYLSYQQQFPLYLEWAVPQPHNLYLALWLQTGIVGLFGFLLLVATWLKRMVLIQKSMEASEDTKRLSNLLVALVLFYLIVGLVDTPFFKTDLAFIFWLIIAFGISLKNK